MTVMLVVACGGDDGLTLDNARDVVSCDGQYVLNGKPIEKCARACVGPDVFESNLTCPDGNQRGAAVIQVGNTLGFCELYTPPGEEPYVDWQPCP